MNDKIQKQVLKGRSPRNVDEWVVKHFSDEEKQQLAEMASELSNAAEEGN